MKISQITETRDMCNVCGQTPCNCTSIMEFAQPGGGDSGDYLKALASAWYNDTFNTGSLQKGIKSQEDVERLLQRGIVCPDGKTRKYDIGYNSNFDGVVISSEDYYEHGDYDGVTDTRTGKPFGPYDVVEFAGDELDESVAEEWSQKYKSSIDCSHPKGFSQKAHCAGRKKHNEGVAEGGFDHYSPMAKDSVKADKIRSLKNLIAIAKEQGRGVRVQELELELKKLQGVAEAVNLDRSKNPNYPNDPATQQHHLDTAKALLSDPKTDPDSRREAAAIVARLEKSGMAEGNKKPESPEADYGDDYQAMVTRVKKLAGLGPLKTVYDPQKRVYRNMPTAEQPKK